MDIFLPHCYINEFVSANYVYLLSIMCVHKLCYSVFVLVYISFVCLCFYFSCLSLFCVVIRLSVCILVHLEVTSNVRHTATRYIEEEKQRT